MVTVSNFLHGRSGISFIGSIWELRNTIGGFACMVDYRHYNTCHRTQLELDQSTQHKPEVERF